MAVYTVTFTPSARFARVPTPLLAPRPASWLCSHSLFRLPRHSPPCQTLAALSAPARRLSHGAHTRSRHFFPHSAHLFPLPKMFHSHAYRRKILCHSCLATLDQEPAPCLFLIIQPCRSPQRQLPLRQPLCPYPPKSTSIHP